MNWLRRLGSPWEPPPSAGAPPRLPQTPCLSPRRLQAGIPTAVASDNVRDQFYDYGDYDLLEVFTQV